jgi:hypothetical protein
MSKPKIFTAVFRDVTTDEAGEIVNHAKWSAGSWSHALDDRDDARHALEAANARIAELEALLVKANDAWRALSQPKKVDLGRKCFRCGHDAHLGDCVNLIPADAQIETGDSQ